MFSLAAMLAIPSVNNGQPNVLIAGLVTLAFAGLLENRITLTAGHTYRFTLQGAASASGTLPDPLRVMTRTREMLWVNRLRTNRTTTGNRRPGEELWVYRRAGRPCRRCGTPIRRAESSDATGDRVTYWCPSCQR